MPEHIKMPAVTPVIRYLADGTQAVFVYPFPVFTADDLSVFLNGAPQAFGYTVQNAGETGGGTVTFATAPASGTVVTLERLLPLERVTDFIEGGDFSARALNNELDALTAGLQQVSRYQAQMLRYGDHETPGDVVLPERSLRAGKALGFNASGDPVAVSLAGSMAAPDFTATGTGAVTRSSADKFGDLVSVRDFGAAGDGLADDTLAFQKALAAHDHVFVPDGTYLIGNTVTVGERKSLIGAGQKAVILCQSNGFAALELSHGYARIENLRIEGGAVGILLQGREGPCVQNNVENVTIWGAATGIKLDGYSDPAKPCYWNNFTRVLVAQPGLHGFHLTLSGAGDTPNANRFHMCRAYSLGADITGSGFYVEHGALNNSFIDCEANVKGTAAACFRLGAGSSKTLLVNPYAESDNGVPNVRIDAGSEETSIINLTAQSDGAAIYDLSGGNFDAVNAGYPDKNRLRRTAVTDLKATLMRFDTEYIDTPGAVALDLSHSVHLVSADGGAITASLPAAASAAGVSMTIKKIDNTANIVTVAETGGPGPDGSTLLLGGENDYVTVLSNGAEWFITATSRMAGNTRYYDGTGIYDIDMAVDVYLLSSYGGALTARLPPANAAKAVGRVITLKKTDVSVNDVTVTEQGGNGPDQAAQILGDQYDAITVASNGSQWYIVSRFG
ncbi:MAG: hypothetical protein HYU57_03155 [Micavibrio aeruginosavorus]|nr:hypothetical protein [Micavibrio aeruginosavorus]